MSQEAGMRWYVLRTHAGHESRVKEDIVKIVDRRGFSDRVGEIVIPTIQVAEIKKGQKKITEKKFMPGYILLQADLSHDDIIFTIQRLPSVAGFVGASKPEILPDEEVKNLLQGLDMTQDASKTEASVTRALFQVGEKVKIVEGPFANFTGTIDDILEDKAKIKVHVEIFGQTTSIELGYLQVTSQLN